MRFEAFREMAPDEEAVACFVGRKSRCQMLGRLRMGLSVFI
jgi:hypothetical protein